MRKSFVQFPPARQEKAKLDIFIILAVLLYLGWAFRFLLSTTYVDPYGARHYVLFDDAMISMRYAFNLANGNGLVWNIGERVEGYTNPLWTIYMSGLISIFGKHFAPLLVQITGVCMVVGAALFAYASARELTQGTTGRKRLAGTVVAISLLGYYPLSYWSLTGMEVSLLSFTLAAGCFFSIRFLERDEKKYLNLLVMCAFLAYFTRPDGWLSFTPLLTVCLYQGITKHGVAWVAKSYTPFVALGLILVALHLAWRFSYYGSLVPNTYILKIQGHPLGMRLRNGFAFVGPFISSIKWELSLSLLSLFILKKERRPLFIALASIPLISIAYQVFVGGDPWPYWRQLAPTVFLFSLISVSSFFSNEGLSTSRSCLKLATGPLILIFAYGVFVLPNWTFRGEAKLKLPPYQYGANFNHVKEGLILSRVLDPHATVMSFWAGAIPYFSSTYAIDPLGKTDAHIANLPPDPGVAWGGMKGVPGHDKHNLSYSIVEKSPDYIQNWRWFHDDQGAFMREHYVAAEYLGIKVCLKRDSKFVHWSLVNIVGDCESNSASSL